MDCIFSVIVLRGQRNQELKMAVFTVYLNLAGKERVEVGSVAFENPDTKEFESVELIQQDAESIEDTVSIAFVPA